MAVTIRGAQRRAFRLFLLSGGALAAAAAAAPDARAQAQAESAAPPAIPAATSSPNPTEGTLALGVISVTAAGTAAMTEGTGSYAAPNTLTPSATGLPLTPRELPQWVGIVTTQEIIDQNFQTLNQVVDYTTGLFAAQGNGEMRWSYFARGSEITNIQIDGVPSYVHYYARDILPPGRHGDLRPRRGGARRDRPAGGHRQSFGERQPGAQVGAGVSPDHRGDRRLDLRQRTGDLRRVQPAERGRDGARPVVAKGVGGDGPRDNLTEDRGLIYGTLDFDIGARTMRAWARYTPGRTSTTTAGAASGPGSTARSTTSTATARPRSGGSIPTARPRPAISTSSTGWITAGR
jgi:hypothetical protein